MKARIVVLMVMVMSLVFSGVSLAKSEVSLDEVFGLIGANGPRGADALSIGNATTATPGFSSDNPALLPTYWANGTKYNFSAFVGGIALQNGPKVAVHAEAVTFKLPVGTAQIFFSDAFSSKHSTPLGVDGEVNRVQKLNLMYGVEIANSLFRKDDSLSIGVSITPPFGSTSMTFSSNGEQVLRSTSSEYSVGGGILYRPTKKISIGASYQESHATATQENIFEDATKTRSTARLIKAGVGVQVTKKLLVTAEYQHIDLGTMTRDQVAGGAEYCVKPAVCLYAGYNGNGATGGIGIYPNKHVSFNVGYAQNISRDTSRPLSGAVNQGDSFGASPAITLQVNIALGGEK